jgi:Tfp pilus assembly PilM family ATPase
MGARFSNMNITTKDGVCFTRGILWGGSDVTSRIKDAEGVSLDEAEALKKEPSGKRESVANATVPALERLSSQIRISLDYFESQSGGSVERLYISGGTSYLFNIADFLKDNVGIDVAMWNPFDGIKIAQPPIEDAEKRPALFSVAVGLALRS